MDEDDRIRTLAPQKEIDEKYDIDRTDPTKGKMAKFLSVDHWLVVMTVLQANQQHLVGLMGEPFARNADKRRELVVASAELFEIIKQLGG